MSYRTVSPNRKMKANSDFSEALDVIFFIEDRDRLEEVAPTNRDGDLQ